jgi:hypothetical protein
MRPGTGLGVTDHEADRARALRRFLQASAVALMVLVAAGLWAGHAMRESLDGEVAGSLRTVLDASVESLATWIGRERAMARSWALHLRDDVVASVVRVDAGGEPAAAPRFAALQEKLAALAQVGGYVGALVVDPAGRVLGATDPGWVGRRASAGQMARVEGVLAGEVAVVPPFPYGLAQAADGGIVPRMLSAAPVRDAGGRVVAVLAALVDPDEAFTRILAVAQTGASGETYAFDRDGLLLSGSRFEADLARLGLIPASAAPSAVLRLVLRDPGGNLLEGHRPGTPRGGLPLTRMAAAAAGGGSGVDVRGHRDYRGVSVVGAWRWLPEVGVGVATQMDQREAYRAMRPALLAFAGLFVLVVAACVLAVFGYYRSLRLRARLERLERLGQYALEEKIGEGGMGEVYRARHALLQRPTAVKLLKRDVMTEEMVARFEREVRLTSRLKHPNTIEVYDFGRSPEGLFYYAMEYLEGVSLADLLADHGALPVARVVHVLMHACLSLEEAHDVGLVHRDVKPANIMLCVRGLDRDVVKVLDFGLVRETSGEDVRLTRHQEVPGTPLYIAPERLRDPSAADPRVDIYSLGVVAYGMLTGRELFGGESSTQVVYHAISTPAPRAREHAPGPLPAALDELVARCLAKDPAARPASVSEMIGVLREVAVAHPWSRDDAARWWREHGERYLAADVSPVAVPGPAP